MNTKYVPAIVMLCAGFVDCILGIYNHASLYEFTLQLFLVLVIFLILGGILKLVLDKTFNKPEEAPEEEEVVGEGTESDEEQGDIENIQSEEIAEDEEES